MSTKKEKARESKLSLAFMKNDFLNKAIRFLCLAVVDAFAVLLLYYLLRDEVWPIAAIVVIATLVVNIVNFSNRLLALRWMSPALAIIILMVLYPIFFTVYTAFTNYGDGHLLTKAQTIRRIGQDFYLPEEGNIYRWAGFRSPEGDFLLWLFDKDDQAFLAFPNQPLEPITPEDARIVQIDEDGFPSGIDEYARMELLEMIPILDSQLAPLEFGEPPLKIRIKSIREAAQLQSRYVYDDAQDLFIDNMTGTAFYADDSKGLYTSVEGASLSPGYQVEIGWQNFQRLFNSPALSGPFITIFIWTIVFALLSVVTTFALGLFLALVFNDTAFKIRKLVRALLIVPYAIPGIIGILIWRGMLNPHFGVLTTNLVNLIGWTPGWFTDPFWSKVGVLLVNLWLGFPYMMLVCSGALQTIPTEIYEAATVDGAGVWQRFRKITLPLLLVNVGPLLISSFTMNFNNFSVIYAYNEGRPPIPGTSTPAGYTDILISYTYRLAFESGRGADYGYANAITIIIFLIVASITLIQYRAMGTWEEISENV